MDESGSMADQDRETYARAAGIIIYGSSYDRRLSEVDVPKW